MRSRSIRNNSLCLRGLTRKNIEALWQQEPGISQPSPRSPLFDHASILAYAEGRPSEGFGERYRIFDQERVLARLPRPPYLFLDQIDKIEHCEQWQLNAGGEIESRYHILSQDWYFEANRQHGVPLAILMEIALQPCGWLAAYLGSALTSESDLSFRNLDIIRWIVEGREIILKSRADALAPIVEGFVKIGDQIRTERS